MELGTPMEVDSPSEEAHIRDLTKDERCALESSEAGLFTTHMDLFGELVNYYGTYQMQSVDPLCDPDTITQILPGTPNLQILFERWGRYQQNGHFICTYYDGKVNHIYDSLNAKSLQSDSEEYLRRIYGRDIVNKIHIVDKQPNDHDCGLFAMAFATTIYFEKDSASPEYKLYDHGKLRKKAIEIFTTKKLSPFPLRSDLWSEQMFAALAPQLAKDFRSLRIL